MANLTFLFCILLVFTFVSGYDRTVTQGRVESCRGCSLNRLPEVKQFIYSDLPHYEKVEFMPIHGAPPELVLLSSAGEEVHRLPLSRLTRLECNELLETHGFKKSLPEAEAEEPPAKSEF